MGHFLLNLNRGGIMEKSLMGVVMGLGLILGNFAVWRQFALASGDWIILWLVAVVVCGLLSLSLTPLDFGDNHPFIGPLEGENMINRLAAKLVSGIGVGLGNYAVCVMLWESSWAWKPLWMLAAAVCLFWSAMFIAFEWGYHSLREEGWAIKRL